MVFIALELLGAARSHSQVKCIGAGCCPAGAVCESAPTSVGTGYAVASGFFIAADLATIGLNTFYKTHLSRDMTSALGIGLGVVSLTVGSQELTNDSKRNLAIANTVAGGLAMVVGMYAFWKESKFTVGPWIGGSTPGVRGSIRF